MSAAAPAPLPRPGPYPQETEDHAPEGVGPGRPTLALAGRPRPDAHAADDPPTTAARGSRGAGTEAPQDARLRVRLVPRVEPPAAPLRAVTPAHERPPVLGSPEALARSRPVVRGPYAAVGAAPAPDGPLPDPTRMCCDLVQAAVEGLRGVRPLAQLVRWVSPDVYDRLALRAQLVQGAPAAPSPARAGIRRVRVFRIGDAVAEATVVVEDGPRVRAVAVRVEGHRGRWRATALEIG